MLMYSAEVEDLSYVQSMPILFSPFFLLVGRLTVGRWQHPPLCELWKVRLALIWTMHLSNISSSLKMHIEVWIDGYPAFDIYATQISFHTKVLQFKCVPGQQKANFYVVWISNKLSDKDIVQTFICRFLPWFNYC